MLHNNNQEVSYLFPHIHHSFAFGIWNCHIHLLGFNVFTEIEGTIAQENM